MAIYSGDLMGCKIPSNWDDLTTLEQLKIADNSDPKSYYCVDDYIEACGFDICYSAMFINYFGESLDPEDTDTMFVNRTVSYIDILNNTIRSYLQQRDELRDNLRDTFGKAKYFKVHNKFTNEISNIQVYYKDDLVNNQYQHHLIQDYIDANHDTHTSFVTVENRHEYICFTFYIDPIQ